MIEIIRHPRDKAESKYNPDVGVSKEDEDRYQKLLVENDELQKLIAQVWYIIMFIQVLTSEKTVQKHIVAIIALSTCSVLKYCS